MEKASLSLYSATAEPQEIQELIRSLFAPVSLRTVTEGRKTTVFLQDSTTIRFHLSHLGSDAEFMEMHLTGMHGCFARAESRNPRLKDNVLRQIDAFTSVTGIVFETDSNGDRTRFILNTLLDLARGSRGLLLYPGLRLYDGEGRLIFSASGESGVEEFTPTTGATGSPHATAADEARWQRSLARLRKAGVPYAGRKRGENLGAEADLKTREEMVRSAVTFFAISVYAEVMLSDRPDRKEALDYLNALDGIYGLSRWMTPAEKAYVDRPDASAREHIEHMWHYETCATLLWAAGIIEELPYPDAICDAPVMAGIIWQGGSVDGLLSRGKPRTEEEILDEADLTSRYQEICSTASRSGGPCPAHLDANVVLERYCSFHWMTGTVPALQARNSQDHPA